MPSSFKQFKAEVLRNPKVRRAYDELEEEFAFLDEVLKARAASGLTQAEVAARVGTTQSAIARLESLSGNHSPSVGTLQKYAKAMGFKLQIRLVPDKGLVSARSSRAKRAVTKSSK